MGTGDMGDSHARQSPSAKQREACCDRRAIHSLRFRGRQTGAPPHESVVSFLKKTAQLVETAPGDRRGRMASPASALSSPTWLAPPRMSWPSTTSAGRASNGSKRAKARSNGRDCHVAFAANAVRLQLHALAYNLGTFLRTLATPEPINDWSLTSRPAPPCSAGCR
jgi:hypothetical protein